jgi:hypothetical protein
MKLKNGPLQRAGYDKDATTPFKQKDETSGEPWTIGSVEFSAMESAGARGEAGGLLPSSYLKKVPGLEHYADKPGKWSISEEEAKKVRAYKASKKQ